MPKPIHAELKAVLVKHGDHVQDLAAMLDINRCLVGRKLSGIDPWETWEIFMIQRHYDLPRDETHIYFPYIEPERLLARRRSVRDKERAKRRAARKSEAAARQSESKKEAAS